jgi:MinD superfamily P-loop ATPase
MVEITILSGKGGTGKTSLTGAWARLAGDKVICDLDVDAPDLHLLLDPRRERTEEFYSGNEARIVQDRCTQCGRCSELCKFRAVSEVDGRLEIDPVRCEGCMVCVHFCPEEAIEFPVRHCGQWYTSQTRFGPMVHAQLFAGQENSGRLVALLRQQAREMAEKRGDQLILSDGPPGIGCPVISSLSGTSLAVVVTEPTMSGVHDLKRVVELCGNFRIPVGVVVNKYDLDLEQSAQVEKFAAENGLTLLGRLPHDPAFIQAMVARKVVGEDGSSPLAEEVARIWKEISKLAEMAQAA